MHRTHTLRGLTLAVVAAGLLLPCQLQAASLHQDAVNIQEPPSAAEVFKRVTVIGASVSAGYGLEVDLKARVTLGDFIDCMVSGEREPCLNLGSNSLFRSPIARSTAQVTEALKHDPTLVVAVDFLFWLVYGLSSETTEARIRRLDIGLDLLDRFKCPVVVGDIPDMSMALKGKGPFGFPLISPAMIPPAEARLAINDHLQTWANSRPRVTLAPLSQFLQTIQSGRTLAVRGNEWRPGDLAGMLQEDLLHPRPQGTLGLLILTFDRLAPSIPDAASRITWNSQKVTARLLERTSEERASNEAAAQRRLERKAKRDRDKHGDRRAPAPAALVTPPG